MIQLYKIENTNYKKNGDFTLEPLSATLHLILNGAWTLTMELPILNKNDNDFGKSDIKELATDFITIGSVVAIDYPYRKHQLFVVDEIQKDDEFLTIICYPIFVMDTKNTVMLDDVRPINKTAYQAVEYLLKDYPQYTLKGSDLGGRTYTAYYQKKNFMEALAGDDDNSIIKRWRCEVEYDNFQIEVAPIITSFSDFVIQYGLNMQGIEVTIDSSDLCTEITPVGAYGRKGTKEKSPLYDNYRTGYSKYIKFEDIVLREDLEPDADTTNLSIYDDVFKFNDALHKEVDKLFKSGIDKPRTTYSIDMIDVSKTDQYKDYSSLLNVWLGSEVTVKNKNLNLDQKTRVVELEYDVIEKEITNLTLNSNKKNYLFN